MITSAVSEQTVTSDKLDYAPGETAIISGEGWVDDTQVRITIDEEPAWDAGHQLIQVKQGTSNRVFKVIKQ